MTDPAHHSTRTFGSGPLLAAILASVVATLPAQGAARTNPVPPTREVAQALTETLSDLAAQPDGTRTAQDRRLVRQVANARGRNLAALVEHDPMAVLALVLPPEQRVRLRSSARRFLEQEVVVEGWVDVLVEDHATDSRVRVDLTTRRGRRYSLHFADAAPALVSGDRIRVRGVRLPRTRKLAVRADGVDLRSMTAVRPLVSGGQRTLVILVNFQDNASQPYTPATAASVFFDTTSAFYREVSGNRLWLEGDVVGWYTIPVSSTGCVSADIATAARNAATAAGAVLSNYTRHVYAFPQNACSWWGLGTVGGVPSQAWINGPLQLMVAGHELGHNLGLYHANALDCDGGTIEGTCTLVSYGDPIDIMGRYNPGHFNAFQKSRLGWVAPATATATGTYWLSPYETGGAYPTALRVLKSTDPISGQRTWYYLEARRATGFDGFLAGNANVLNGIVLHTGSDASGNSSNLLDLTPATSSWTDPALVVGATFTDPQAGVTIRPQSVSADGMAVDITFGTATCVAAAPTVAVSPSAVRWVTAGTTLAYDVTVTNNDSAACSATGFGVSATPPADGWIAVGGTPLTLAAGGSATTSVQVTSSPGATDGLYNAPVAVTRGGPGASGNAPYGIASTLEVTTWPGQTTYPTGGLVSVWTLVTSGGSPVANAAVTVTIRKPDGRVATLTGTTGTTGYAQQNLRLRRDDPEGTYAIATSAGQAPGPVGSATSTFLVKKSTGRK